LGSQYSAIFIDEAVTFEPFEEFILPLLGRLRNAKVDYVPQMFWATNPRYNHGIYHWIKDFYLGQDGCPLKEKSNVERFFVLENNKPVWFDSREAAESIYGGGENSPIRSFRGIRAHLSDNIPLITANPQYEANLKALPEIKRRIFLDGSWTAREEEAGYFNRIWSKIVPFPNALAVRRTRCWDLASTPVSSARPSPDWTRGVLVSKDKLGYYTVEDVQSLRDRPHEVEQLIYRTARADPIGTIQHIPVDPGAAGIGYANTIKKNLAEMGIPCRVTRVSKSKLQRFLPFSAIAEAGYVQFVKSEWLETAFDELENFNGERNNGFDDICDCCSDAMVVLNQGAVLPMFTLPNLTQSTQFGFQSSQIPSDLVTPL
jgi:predicted phage terminase large subunit-like protein